jgi:hypothetical protein
MARRWSIALPARGVCAGAALLLGLAVGAASPPEDGGLPPHRIEIGAVLRPAGEGPMLLITVPEPDQPAGR